MLGTWTFSDVVRLASAVCFFVALAVSLGWFAHNWEAWASAGLLLLAVSGLPPASPRVRP